MIFRYLIFTLLSVFSMVATAQVSFFNIKNEKPALTESDSVLLESLPELKLPETLKVRDLPVAHDNSDSPYLRPVFEQNGACCGQASGIAYNFTYEINRLRDLSSKDTVNQYPSHFTWNFQNGGDGYYGVSYLHSFDILKHAGNPTVEVYGGMDNTNGVMWMTGYDKYFSSMHNRVRGMSQIVVNTDEGLLTLKHWLNNHLEGSEHGGVAGFYASSPYGYNDLPEDSPEAGKHVMTNFSGTSATHAMTVVGYHDSIRFDYNGDGLYTTDIDINDDGLVDMRDREIGGLKFVNSYGDDWADSGFCYMMYKTLADKLGQGGIWNHCVHVVDAKADYEPELTLKFTIRHDSREKIKITAGVASDTGALIPEHVMHFPLFNYQGGHHYMQGGRQNEVNKFLEAGLDITPLLGYINPGEPAKFFLQITETDPLNEGTGRLIGFTLMDYTDGVTAIPCQDQDVQLVENGVTRLGIIHAPDFEKVNITTEELPALTGGNNYQAQLEAQNGTEPYNWSLITPWHEQRYNLPMPEIDDERLYTEMPNLHYAAKKIGFEFPFYGEMFDSVYVHENGFLMFGPDLYPWPYFNDPFLLFKRMKNISAFHFNTIEYYNDPLRDEPEIWYEGNQYFAAFRWNGPLFYFDQHVGEGEYAVVLYPDGNVDFFYNDIQLDEDVIWYAGVSAGNEVNYTLLKNANSIVPPEVSSYRLIPEPLPGGLQLSPEGLLNGNIESSEQIHTITARVNDDRSVTDQRDFQLSDGLIFSYEINAGGDGLIENEEVFTIDLTVKNIYSDSFSNVAADFVDDDPNLELINTNASFGDLSPGESQTVEDAFTLKVMADCPNQYTFFSGLSLASDEADWNGTVHFESFAPSMRINSFMLQDDNNNRLDPGETAAIAIRVSNTGMLTNTDVQVGLYTDNPHITVFDPSLPYGELKPGEEKTMLFQVAADEDTPIAEEVSFDVMLSFNNGYEVSSTFQITIGQYTAVVFRKGSNPASAESIVDALESLGMDVVYTTSLPEEFSMFRSVFVCLGGFLESNALSQQEASHLLTYLNGGGNLYMEGTMTWAFDPQTSLHPRFNVNPQQTSFINFNEITGVAGTFTAGMNFNFSGANSVLACLMFPEAPAYSIFNADGDDEKCIATANPETGYRTIGVVNEFGTMGGESDSLQRREYMYGMLEFFGLEEYVVDIEEITASMVEELAVEVFPNPFVHSAGIRVVMDETASLEIDIYDLGGKHIRKLVSDVRNPGVYAFSWGGYDRFGRQVPPGIYIYQVRAGDLTKTGKLVRMK